jgi:hypothetical protein
VFARPLHLSAGLLHWDGVAMKMVAPVKHPRKPVRKRTSRGVGLP